MKKLLLFTFAICLIPYTFSQQYGWVDISANIQGTTDFSDVFFTAADTGWITESGQANIYKTVDGAASFSIQTTPQGGTSAIHMLDSDNGYSGGQGGGWIYKTNDGGLNWNILASMGTFLDMSFPFDANPDNPTGYASGNSGNVWEITSTLSNLNSPSSSTFSGISAPSINNVWVCGGNRIYYYNGSEFTSQVGPNGAFNDIHFINNMEGWVVGDLAVIGHTEDGGVSWITQINPDPQNRSLYAVFFLDSNNGWAVGADGIILHTSDGGTNWIIEAEGLTTSFLRGVHFTSSTNGYVAGNDKTLLKYGEVSGINDSQALALDFDVYPNPCQDELTVRYSLSDTRYSIFEAIDNKGSIVKSMELQRQETTIDVSDLTSGIYYIKLQMEDAVGVRKIIIK